jgi:hypothetical protein
MTKKVPSKSSAFWSVFLLGWFWLVFPPISEASAQQVFHTQWVDIHYQNLADLREMDQRLRFTGDDNFLRTYAIAPDQSQVASCPRLGAKIDGTLHQVCQTLNLRPQKQNRLRVFLLKDGAQVRQRHLVLQPGQGPALFGYSPLAAFYERRSRTIFLALADLREGILAHEMAHFILCESYSVPPPASLQDDWARYVELKLE